MASTTSQALTKRPAPSSELMPPPTTKRIKRPPKVLDEEDYEAALSEIIERDFYPGLEQTRSQMEYLDALQSNDYDWIASAGRNLTQTMTPGSYQRRTPRATDGGWTGATPKTFVGDTPMSIRSDTSAATTQTEASKANVNMRLDTFLSKYTGEDNESFYKVVDKQNQQRANRYAWAFSGNRLLAPRELLQRQRELKLLDEKSSQEGIDGGRQLAQIKADGNKPARPEGWRSSSRNQLMFAPDSIEDHLITVQQQAEIESKAPPKEVVYSNTRLPQPQPDPDPDPDPARPPSPSLSVVRAAIAGRVKPTESETGYTGAETPRVNGYAFVDEDEPEPKLEPTYNANQYLDSVDSTPSPFKLQQQSKREALHDRMVEKVAKTTRASSKVRQHALQTESPIPKFTSSPIIRTTPLTPAAQRLWDKVGTPKGGGLGGAFDPGRTKRESGLRHRWTPTPKVKQSKKE